MNKAIGGYFSLELPRREEYHKDAIKLNTGRNGLEYILRSRNYKKVFIPYYTCEVILEPFHKLGIQYEFYHISLNLELSEDICLRENEALLYTNYYGLKQDYVKKLAGIYGKRLIVDNTQAFFAEPIYGIDTFYTCRKFFGVPDGAYLFTDKTLDIELANDSSWERMDSLTKRIDIGAEAGYADFRRISELLAGQSILKMSALTERLMQSIDYEQVIKRRRSNFMVLHNELKKTNRFYIDMDAEAVPMVYPYMTDSETLRANLIRNKIFVAKYWPNVEEWVTEDSVESLLTNYLIPLPIDQRYGEEDMKSIINKIKIEI